MTKKKQQQQIELKLIKINIISISKLKYDNKRRDENGTG